MCVTYNLHYTERSERSKSNLYGVLMGDPVGENALLKSYKRFISTFRITYLHGRRICVNND